MTSQVELNRRPCDENGCIEVEGARVSDETMTQLLETDDKKAEENANYLTTDSMPAKLPEYILSRKSFKPEADDQTSCIKVPALFGGMKKYFSVKYMRNTRALAAGESTYKLETFEKNAMIIFNQTAVKGYGQHKMRSQKDGKRIGRTLKKFGFEGDEHFDLTRKQIFKTLNQFSNMDFTDYGCVVIVVMTYGTDDGQLMAKDKKYSEQQILNYFKHKKRPKLVTKPVILIIQACRRTKELTDRIVHFSRTEKDTLQEEEKKYSLPVEADTLVLHISYSSKVSQRELNGTWFIKSLCYNIEALSDTHDFESILLEVKREVYQNNRQTAIKSSGLMRKLYLNKFGEKPPVIEETISTNTSKVAPSATSNGVDNESKLSYRPGPTQAQVLNRYHYMRNILLEYAEDKNDKTANFLLAESVDVKCDMQMTLLAMSNFLKEKYRNTEYENLILFYEIEKDTLTGSG